MNRIFARLVTSIVFVLALRSSTVGEVFILHNGGRLVGELLNPDQVPRETYVIRTSSGGQITLPGSQVKDVEYQRPAEIEYEKMRPRYPDTIEGQWELAEWCREHTLLSQRKVHLERILELDPDHEQARRALKYGQYDGQWKTHEQVMKERGYVLYKGRWMLPQRVRLIEEEQKIKAAEGEWKYKVNLWRDWLGDGKHREACENFRKIDDPFAVPALAAALKDDARDQARLLYIETLSRIGTPDARMLLAEGAIYDPVPEVRLTCLDYLKKEENPAAVRYFVGELRSKDNDKINKAAVALRQMGDRSAIGPLIDALITIHKRRISQGNPGQISTTFGSGGSGVPGGLSVGGRPKIVRYPVKNQDVLDALVSLTGGVNYEFDDRRWRAWYAAQKRNEAFDSRRD